MRALLSSLLLSLTVIAGATAHASAPADPKIGENRCWADWTAASPVVHKEALRPAKDVRELAKKHGQGQLLNITLCSEQGKYVYRLLFLKTAGTLEAVTVDARQPFGR